MPKVSLGTTERTGPLGNSKSWLGFAPLLLAALALQACLKSEECDMRSCAEVEYVLKSLRIDSTRPPNWTPIDTFAFGQLYVRVEIMRSTALGKEAASRTSCLSCEALIGNSSLTVDHPIIVAGDTIPALANLLEATVLSRIGTGSASAIIFHKGVRFKRGENLFNFAGGLNIQKSRKIDSVQLSKKVIVTDSSAWN